MTRDTGNKTTLTLKSRNIFAQLQILQLSETDTKITMFKEHCKRTIANLKIPQGLGY